MAALIYSYRTATRPIIGYLDPEEKTIPMTVTVPRISIQCFAPAPLLWAFYVLPKPYVHQYTLGLIIWVAFLKCGSGFYKNLSECISITSENSLSNSHFSLLTEEGPSKLFEKCPLTHLEVIPSYLKRWLDLINQKKLLEEQRRVDIIQEDTTKQELFIEQMLRDHYGLTKPGCTIEQMVWDIRNCIEYYAELVAISHYLCHDSSLEISNVKEWIENCLICNTKAHIKNLEIETMMRIILKAETAQEALERLTEQTQQQFLL